MRRNILKSVVLLLTFVSFSSLAFAATDIGYDSMMGEGLATGAFGLSMIVTVLFSILCYCVPIIIGLGLFAIWIWMLVDVLKREEKDFGPGTNNKLIWLLVLLLTNGIGAIVYYFMIYNKKCCK